MVDIGTGLFLGGAARQRTADRELGLRERAIGVQEKQLRFQQQTEQRNAVMEAIGKTTEQAVNLIEAATNRDQPGFSASLGQLRSSVERLASQAEQAGIGITAESVLQNFDNLVLSTQTAGEKAATEAEAGVVGAQATVEGIADLPADQQAQVGQLLGLTEPRQTQEFFGLLPLLDDPSLTPEQRNFVTGRLNKLTSNNQLGLVFNVDPETGNVTVAQLPASEVGSAIPNRQTLSGRQLDRLRGQRDTITQGINIARSLIDNTAPLGIRLDVRRMSENLTGGVADLLGVEESELVDRFQALLAQTDFEDPTSFDVGTIDAAEGFLMFAVARALNPDQDRILASTLERARSLTRLGGFTSDERVRERLDTIVTILESADANLQRRQQQGVGGTTTVERQPPIAEDASPVEEAEDTLDEIDELLRQLDELLGDG